MMYIDQLFKLFRSRISECQPLPYLPITISLVVRAFLCKIPRHDEFPESTNSVLDL